MSDTALSVVFQLPPDAADVWAWSLRNVYHGHAVLLTDNPESYEHLHRKYHISLLPPVLEPDDIPEWFPQPAPFFMTRLLMYRWAVKNMTCERIFVTDATDVYFQRNPFDDDSGVLNFYREATGMHFRHSWFMRANLALIYGADALWDMRDRPIYCAGTILGTQQRMLQLYDDLIEEYRSVLSTDVPAERIQCDQTLLNYMIHDDRLDNISLHGNDDGRVHTMALMKGDQVRIEDDMIVDGRGHTPAVVHQYNRHPHAEGLIQRLRSLE